MISTYIEPSVALTRVIVPDGINIAAQPFAVTLIGTGSRFKRVNNEAVLRGVIQDETLTVAGTAPHISTLAQRADRRLENTVLTRTLNGIDTEISDAYVTYLPAYVTGTITAAVDLDPDSAPGSRENAISLEADGQEAVTISMFDAASFVFDNLGLDFALSVGTTQTLTDDLQTFRTKGVRPGMRLTITNATTAAGVNNGTSLLITAVTETTISYTKTDGVIETSADADLAITGVGLNGREISVVATFSGTNANAATMTQIATAINAGLNAASTLGYSATHAYATVVSSALRITSSLPNGSPLSDVRVFAPVADSGLTVIFGASAAGTRNAQTRILLATIVYNASATYALDYVQQVGQYETGNETDPLANTAIQRLVSVGSSRESTYFSENADWVLTSDAVDWSPDTAAAIVSSAILHATDNNLATANLLTLRVDGKLGSTSGTENIVINLTTEAVPPIGYVTPTPGTVTQAQIFGNINAILAREIGPRYANVASIASNLLTLTSPIQGATSSSLFVVASTATSAHDALFAGTPYDLGSGKRPIIGSTYYATYEYTRPANDYDGPIRHYSVGSALAQVGNPSPAVANYNPLAIAAQIAFENGANYIFTVQIDDSIAEGNPTRNEVRSALEGAKISALCTEIIVVGEPGTRPETAVDTVDHLEDQNSPLEKHYRRMFAGMAAGTEVGSRDEADTLVYRASRTLQVSPASPARGRMFLVQGPQSGAITREVVYEDGTESTVSLDGTYVAVAVAARRTALQEVADTLTRKTITGFNTDDITSPYKPGERRTLASQGVLVVELDAGRLIMRDALSTEQGGGGIQDFVIDSATYQVDVVTVKMNRALDANVIGIVPYDLANFILDIKLIMASVLSGEVANRTIGPFRDSSTGATRQLDLRTDIRVTQDINDETKFLVKYWFNLRKPCLRIEGSYSTGNPFFSLTA